MIFVSLYPLVFHRSPKRLVGVIVGKVVGEKLTAKAVEAAKPGRHHDGDGLVLVVSPKGVKRWEQRLKIGGVRRDVPVGLGSTTLAQARQVARDNLRIARDGAARASPSRWSPSPPPPRPCCGRRPTN